MERDMSDKPKLYLTIRAGPLGFTKNDWPARITFHREKHENLLALSRGEGQVLQFALDGYDVSTAFGEALDTGEVLEFFDFYQWSLRCHDKDKLV